MSCGKRLTEGRRPSTNDPPTKRGISAIERDADALREEPGVHDERSVFRRRCEAKDQDGPSWGAAQPASGRRCSATGSAARLSPCSPAGPEALDWLPLAAEGELKSAMRKQYERRGVFQGA